MAGLRSWSQLHRSIGKTSSLEQQLSRLGENCFLKNVTGFSAPRHRSNDRTDKLRVSVNYGTGLD
jgi:hypothetical protein